MALSSVSPAHPTATAQIPLPPRHPPTQHPSRYITANTPPPPHRRRFSHNNGRVHCEPRNRQTHTGARHHLVLPVRVGRRHAGRRRHCQIPARAVRHDERQAADDADGGRHLPGDLLLEQGQAFVSFTYIRGGRDGYYSWLGCNG